MADLILIQSLTTTQCYRIVDLDTQYTGDDRQCYWYVNNIPRAITSLQPHDWFSNIVEFDGMTPNTPYWIRCDIDYNGGTTSLTYENVYTANINNRPNYFYWSDYKQKDSGGAFNITANEWNNFTSNINQVRSWASITTQYGFDVAVSGNPFTALHYSQAVEAIQDVYGYGADLSMKQSGSPIYASDINMLVSELNSII